MKNLKKSVMIHLVLITAMTLAFVILSSSLAVLAEGGRLDTEENLGLVFADGVAQPVFSSKDIIREVVYVETNLDSDGDGKADKIRVLIQRPTPREEGMKIASIFEARPYSAGVTDAYDYDIWNEHIVNAKLSQADESTHTTKEDWDWRLMLEDGEKEILQQKINSSAEAENGGDIWENTSNVNAYDYWLIRGYAYVSSSGLGTFGSDGFQSCAGADETEAFAAVVKWLSGDESVKAFKDKDSNIEIKANWSNGNVAMTGQSYAGSTAFAVASTGVDGLRTIVTRAAIASWYDYYRSQGIAAAALYYPGDDCSILADYCMSRRLDEADYADIEEDYVNFLAGMKEAEDALSGDYNYFWDERNYTNGSENLNCSALIIHGLNDFNVRTKQFDLMYNSFKNNNQDVKLILHQGAHYTPEALVDLNYNEILGRWYAHYLYGLDNGANKEAEVRIQNNIDLVWDSYDSWSGENKYIKFDVKEDKASLTSDLAVTSFDISLADIDEAWIEYASDMSYEWENEIINGSTAASLVYSFDIDEDLHISGITEVQVKASSDQPTGILSAMLVDIAPTGGMKAVLLGEYSEAVPTEVVEEGALVYGGDLENLDLVQFILTETNNKIITKGWMDIQNRNSIYNIDIIEPDVFYDFKLELQPMDYVVKAGHKLALVIYSVDPEVNYWPEQITNFTVDGSNTYVNVPVK